MANEVNGDFQSTDPSDLFAYFLEKACDVPSITVSLEALKKQLKLQNTSGIDLYTGLKSKLNFWKAKSLWELLDKKVSVCYV